MGVEFRESEIFLKAVREFLRLDVFQFLGQFVDLIPLESQFAHQKGFPQPVLPDDLNGRLSALLGERRPLILLVIHHSLVREPPDHIRYRGGFGIELLCDRVGTRPFGLPLIKCENGLEIILLGMGIHVFFAKVRSGFGCPLVKFRVV